ncbi:MAG: YjgN family protein [Alphaproteobacteria bacterium]
MDSPPTAHDSQKRLVHHGIAGELFKIHLVNVLLTIGTLGIYRFWARTRIRNYLWSQTSFLGDRLEYTGTGKELFLGFLIALAILVPIWVGYRTLSEVIAVQRPGLTIVLDTVFYSGLVFLVGVAIYRARRFRLSRTLWRGIRGGQTGSATDYGARSAAYLLLTILTLGLYWPFMDARLTGYKLNNTWFGDRRFTFDGDGRDLFKPFAICWLLFIPTLFMSWFWYRAAALEYYAGRTRYEDLRFAAEVRPWPLTRLIVTNWLLRVFTLGLAYPWVMIRTARFVCANLDIVGDQDFAAIAQSRQPAPTTGEGLAATLDVGDF